MIRGNVDDLGAARIPLEIRGSDGQYHPIGPAIDTGFNGYLTLPPALIRRLGLAPRESTEVTLATGTREKLNTWQGQILWHNRPRAIQVLESRGAPLLGRGLLAGSQLTIQVWVNGEVLIEELAEIPP